MTPEEIDNIIEESRAQRVHSLGEHLLRHSDRSADFLQKLRWELEEELNESLYVSLDMLGWNQELLVPDLQSHQQDLAQLLTFFEEREEYECCVTVREAQGWLQGRIEFFLEQIRSGETPENLIGL